MRGRLGCGEFGLRVPEHEHVRVIEGGWAGQLVNAGHVLLRVQILHDGLPAVADVIRGPAQHMWSAVG